MIIPVPRRAYITHPGEPEDAGVADGGGVTVADLGSTTVVDGGDAAGGNAVGVKVGASVVKTPTGIQAL